MTRLTATNGLSIMIFASISLFFHAEARKTRRNPADSSASPASPRENRLARFVHRIRLANELEVIFMRKSFLAILILILALPLVADEGMWLFNRTPNAIFK